MGDMLNNDKTYWDVNATVRYTERLIFDRELEGDIFPIARQPLCIHPKVIERGHDIVQYILTQTLYRYLSEIAYSELEVINAAALKLSNNQYRITLPFALRQEVLSVIIDEAYHAYVARDFMAQVTEATNVIPIERAADGDLDRAIDIASQGLNPELKESLFLLGVCIAENSLTQDLVNIAKFSSLNPGVMTLMKDHVRDEGRHTSLFKTIFKLMWEDFSEDEKDLIGERLLVVMQHYLSYDSQIRFNRLLLTKCDFSSQEIESILEDTHFDANDLLTVNPTVKNIMRLFKSVNIFLHPPTKACFATKGLI